MNNSEAAMLAYLPADGEWGKAAMKERPILFSDPMVRAILEGRKTQTRRVVKPQPPTPIYAPGWPRRHQDCLWYFATQDLSPSRNGMVVTERRCPFGQPGDRLWVRECFTALGNVGDARAPQFIYRADFQHDDAQPPLRWRPSIHMPRWASRLTLEVTGVSVERLQEISQNDAVAEGVMEWMVGPTAPTDDFRSLWESINGAGSWTANPWVWVVEFRRVV